jgi:hypothetical protein
MMHWSLWKSAISSHAEGDAARRWAIHQNDFGQARFRSLITADRTADGRRNVFGA